MKIPDIVKHLLDKQHFVVVSTVNEKNVVHTSAKGIVDVHPSGKIFILDLYKAKTYSNIVKNPSVALTVIDEINFKGYSINGKAEIVEKHNIPKGKMDNWDEKLAKRIARRVINHVKQGKPGKEAIPEASFPLPEYLIEVSVEGITDLAPQKLK